MSSKNERSGSGTGAARVILAFLVGAMGAATLASMSGCCGGAPSHACKFVEVPKDAGMDMGGSDTMPPCGFEICDPRTTYCCVKQNPASFTCIPLSEQCDGVTQVCSGDDDCVPGSGLHCCVHLGSPQTLCEPSCSGNFTVDGTFRICRTSTECPPDRASCGQIVISGQNINACLAPGE